MMNPKSSKRKNVSTTTLTSGLVAKSLFVFVGWFCFVFLLAFLEVLIWSWLIWINLRNNVLYRNSGSSFGPGCMLPRLCERPTSQLRLLVRVRSSASASVSVSNDFCLLCPNPEGKHIKPMEVHEILSMKWHHIVQFPHIREYSIYLTWIQDHFQRNSCAKFLQEVVLEGQQYVRMKSCECQFLTERGLP